MPCDNIEKEIEALKVDRDDLSEELKNASPSQKPGLAKQIKQINELITIKKKELNDCLNRSKQEVDLSVYLGYIRDQDGGCCCWGYAMLAMWDIMNEMECPYSPNLSMRLWTYLHYHRELWVSQGGIYTPDGRYHEIRKNAYKEPSYEFGLYQSLGCATEGTEITAREYPVDWPDPHWTMEGINEANNYRLDGDPKIIDISSQSFINELNKNIPIRLNIQPKSGQGHYVAVIGYNKLAKTFKVINSSGDNWEQDGYGSLTFQDVDTTNITSHWFANYKISLAETIKIYPPRPVPAARISFKHTNRSNVHLWLYAENSPLQRKKIWPQGWRENCRNLSYTVRLPSEFIWPPSADNRLVLELYDAAEFSNTGGQLTEFTAAFGGHILKSSQLSRGPINFQAREYLHICIP